jgi:hypothetical protein
VRDEEEASPQHSGKESGRQGWQQPQGLVETRSDREKK